MQLLSALAPFYYQWCMSCLISLLQFVYLLQVAVDAQTGAPELTSHRKDEVLDQFLSHRAPVSANGYEDLPKD